MSFLVSALESDKKVCSRQATYQLIFQSFVVQAPPPRFDVRVKIIIVAATPYKVCQQIQMADVERHKCLFCRIADNQEPNSRLLYEKDGVVIFKDIRPAAAHHYLVVPQKHVKDPKHLGPEDLDLVNTLVTVGEEFLAQEGADTTDTRFGFHWPPFNSISHLHLHVISPASSMGVIASLIFKPNTLWFVTADWLVNRLKNMKRI